MDYCQEGALEKVEHEGNDECKAGCPDDDPHVCGDKSKGFLRSGYCPVMIVISLSIALQRLLPV